jgi:hypothetical protein
MGALFDEYSWWRTLRGFGQQRRCHWVPAPPRIVFIRMIKRIHSAQNPLVKIRGGELRRIAESAELLSTNPRLDSDALQDGSPFAVLSSEAVARFAQASQSKTEKRTHRKRSQLALRWKCDAVDNQQSGG